MPHRPGSQSRMKPSSASSQCVIIPNKVKRGTGRPRRARTSQFIAQKSPCRIALKPAGELDNGEHDEIGPRRRQWSRTQAPHGANCECHPIPRRRDDVFCGGTCKTSGLPRTQDLRQSGRARLELRVQLRSPKLPEVWRSRLATLQYRGPARAIKVRAHQTGIPKSCGARFDCAKPAQKTAASAPSPKPPRRAAPGPREIVDVGSSRAPPYGRRHELVRRPVAPTRRRRQDVGRGRARSQRRRCAPCRPSASDLAPRELQFQPARRPLDPDRPRRAPRPARVLALDLHQRVRGELARGPPSC